MQVVYASHATNVNTSTNTFIDTGLTATITPTSATSTILVMVQQGGLRKDNNTGISLQLLRGASVILSTATTYGFTNAVEINNIGASGIDYKDSPATTSATTYKTQFRSSENNAQAGVQANNDPSSMVLMEIGA